MKLRVGVDTGGTFTDCVVIDEQGRIHTFKELSTPKDPSIGLYNVIRKAAAASSPSSISWPTARPWPPTPCLPRAVPRQG